MLSISMYAIFNLLYFTDHLRAYDSVWILGDVFMAHSYKQFFKNARSPNGNLGYLSAHYDISSFFYSYDDNPQGNVLNRLVNLLIMAIGEETLLPKAIIIVLNDDIMDELNHYTTGITISIGKMIEWLMNQIHNIITRYKEKLPSKSRKFKYPTVLWTLIPLHKMYDQFNDF